ncbi:MAG TPA: hypothetical protein VFV66_22800 [Nonomuraea sp.]|nr:hypothetical protein [Nonomuraea sp.]
MLRTGCLKAVTSVAGSSSPKPEVVAGLLILAIFGYGINSLMLQDVLAEQEWATLLKPADRRGLTPLFWRHVQPYGEVRLDLLCRIRQCLPRFSHTARVIVRIAAEPSRMIVIRAQRPPSRRPGSWTRATAWRR